MFLGALKVDRVTEGAFQHKKEKTGAPEVG
jgi:hypothetical protein